MSKRNFILLIIILVIIIIGIFAFLFFNRNTAPGDSTGTNFGSIFNPFGTTKPKPPVVTPPADVSGYVPPTPPIVENIKLKKVSSMPIAGFTVYQKEKLKEVATVTPDPTITPPKKVPAPLTEFMPALRYATRENGNIYQTFADKILEQKFSSTVIPKIYEAFLGNKGETVVLRYLKEDGRTIQTFVGNLPKELFGSEVTGNNELKGSFLPENIKDISLSPDALNIFYLFSVGENTIGTTMNLATSKKVQIFDSAFNEWLSLFPSNKLITFTTKPSSNVPGYMYAMDPGAKNFYNVLGGINGLTTLTSPSGKLVLYGSGLSLNIFHTDTKTVEAVGFRTMPEKCVWNKTSSAVYCAVPKTNNGGEYPNSWYQGEVSFSDQIWKMDMTTGNTTLLVDPITVKGGEEIDGTKLMLDDSENYLFFVNKKDSFLWELALQ